MPVLPAQVLSVSELTHRVKNLLEERFSSVWVEGEISNVRSPSSGHIYFTLKDTGSQLAVVAFRGVAVKVGFTLKDGSQVIAFGDISIYEKSGQYQLVARQLLQKGLGALQLAFEELKRRLAKEGLFDSSRKRPIPILPQRIGLITSPTGAAIRDFLNIINRRFPNLHIVIHPVRVQGEGAAAEIAAAIDNFNALQASGRLPLDVLIVTRGGGSLEDLWAFNEEVVARALARSKIPTISAVGHEIDFTIADFAADLRAPTPSAAAELVVKAKEEFKQRMAEYQSRLRGDLRFRLATTRQRFSDLASNYVFRRPTEIIRQYQQQVDDSGHRLVRATSATLAGRRARLVTAAGKFKLLGPQALLAKGRQRIDSHEQSLRAACNRRWEETGHRFAQVRGKLELLNPSATLRRGYSITLDPETGEIVRSVTHVTPGTKISTKVLDGVFDSVVSSSTDVR